MKAAILALPDDDATALAHGLDGLPPDVRREVETELWDVRGKLHVLAREDALVDQQTREDWLSVVGSRVHGWLAVERTRAEALGAARMEEELRHLEHDLGDFLFQAEIIRFEVVTGCHGGS